MKKMCLFMLQAQPNCLSHGKAQYAMIKQHNISLFMISTAQIQKHIKTNRPKARLIPLKKKIHRNQQLS